MNKIQKLALTGFVLAMALTFSCSSDDSGEGNDGDKGNDIRNYRTVKIGNQEWMAENLNYNIAGSKCYDNKPENCVKYGRLYDWATAMALPSMEFPSYCYGNDNDKTDFCNSQRNTKHQGICPSGWRLPARDDWNALINYVENEKGCSNCAGKYLKAKSGWDYSGNGEDAYNFAALPSGAFVNSSTDGSIPYVGIGNFSFVGNNSYWWTSELLSPKTGGLENAGYTMSCNFDGIYPAGYQYIYGLFSVRCVKD